MSIGLSKRKSCLQMQRNLKHHLLVCSLFHTCWILNVIWFSCHLAFQMQVMLILILWYLYTDDNVTVLLDAVLCMLLLPSWCIYKRWCFLVHLLSFIFRWHGMLEQFKLLYVLYFSQEKIVYFRWSIQSLIKIIFNHGIWWWFNWSSSLLNFLFSQHILFIAHHFLLEIQILDVIAFSYLT